MEGTPCRPCWIDTEGHRLFCLLVLIFGLSLWSVFLHCLKVEFLMRRIILFILGLGFAVFVLLPTVHHEVAEFRCWGFYVVFLWFFRQWMRNRLYVCVPHLSVTRDWSAEPMGCLQPALEERALVLSSQSAKSVDVTQNCWETQRFWKCYRVFECFKLFAEMFDWMFVSYL